MTRLRRSTPVVALAALLLVFGCGDSGTDVPVPTTVMISGGPITLNEIGQTATLEATVLDQDGDPIPDASPTFSSSDPSVATVSGSGVVTATGDGSATITASLGTVVSSPVAVDVTVSVLQEGGAVPGLSGAAGSTRLFTFQVLPGADRVVEFFTLGGSGDADVLVRFDVAPTLDTFDCASQAPENTEFCTITNPQPGTWNVLLVGFEAYQGVELGVRFLPLTTLQDGVAVTGISGSTDEFLYFNFQVPTSVAGGLVSADPGMERHDGSRVLRGRDGSGATTLEAYKGRSREDRTDAVQAQAGVPTLTVTTAGGTGDVGLAGGSGNVLSQTVPIECLSFEVGNAERCDVPSPEGGEWLFALIGVTDFAGVALQADFVPAEAVDPGMITLQKTIQSFAGGTPDNPANPSLSGFEFEIRASGSTAAVETVTTDVNGQAVATVPPGVYDIVESDPQGLTDATGPVAGVEVTEGGNVNVGWINRQPPVGNQDPVAVINASPASVPQGDGNATTVTLFAGNSSDPNGDPLTFAWTVQNGTFVGGTTATSTTAKVTFPGTAASTVTLTVSDGDGGQNVAQTTIGLGTTLPPAGTFNIELVNVATPSASVQEALNVARDTWEAIIRNEVANVNFAADPVADSTCFPKQPEIADIVDDLRIYVDIAPDDGPGGRLGSAGPCIIRGSLQDPSFPIIGQMRFDSDDLNILSPDALNGVILHEMAHVLGIGGFWNVVGLLENPSCPGGACEPDDPPGPDTRYLGLDGIAAWRSLGGPNDEAVPVENGEGVDAGAGNRDSHWREIVFGNELMTGFLNGGIPNPLSQLTIAALVDLGYRVDFSQADPYAIPSMLAAPALADAPLLDLRDDVRKGPVYMVDENGRILRIIDPGR